MTHLGAVIDMWGGHGSDDGQFAQWHHGGMMGIAIGPQAMSSSPTREFSRQVFAQDGTFRASSGPGQRRWAVLKPPQWRRQ
ncbi:MAG: hypothetical protein CM1200mP41_25280 [Gammaproteobacteria bacterium]|nr:MAG: hypothetical protein CM1200mP41_25280 [Gammaproteobacteria bacterium]